MGKMISQRKSTIVFWLLVVLSVTWMGCATTVKRRQQGQAAGESTGATTSGGEETGKYYFDDVRVPEELNYKANKSFIYETPGFKAGILVFSKWRLDVDSLIEYFKYNMEKDNWKLVNSFRGEESILNFTKPDKACVIKIVERWCGTTVLEIRVGPLGEKKM
jgi:hypothetical protein